MAVLPQRLHVSRWKCKIHRQQNAQRESWYKSLEKNAKLTETKMINAIMQQIFR